MWCGQLNNVFVTGGYVRVLHGVVLTMLWHIVWYATVLGPAIQTMKRSIPVSYTHLTLPTTPYV